MELDWCTLYSASGYGNVLHVARPLLDFSSGIWVHDTCTGDSCIEHPGGYLYTEGHLTWGTSYTPIPVHKFPTLLKLNFIQQSGL